MAVMKFPAGLSVCAPLPTAVKAPTSLAEKTFLRLHLYLNYMASRERLSPGFQRSQQATVGNSAACFDKENFSASALRRYRDGFLPSGGSTP